MNERHDDLASAWLDGELDDVERQQLADDAEADEAVRRARLELAAAQDALARPVPVPDGLADAQIARAIEALPVPVAAQARVVPLPSRPTPRRGGLLARVAAAVLVVAGVGIGAAAVLDDPRGTDDVALTATSGGTAETGAAEDAGGADSRAAEEGVEGAEGADREEGSSSLAAPEDDVATAEAAGLLATTATELVAAEDLDAPALLEALERLHGDAASWPAEPVPPDSCVPTLPTAERDADAPVVAVAFDRAGVALELIVPAQGAAYFLERGPCRLVE